MTLVATIAAAVLGAAALRAISIRRYRSWFAQGFVGDASVHYTIVRQLKKNRRAKWIDQYLIRPEPMSYPTGFHRYVSIFPLEVIRRRSYMPNAIVAALAPAIMVVYTWHILPPHDRTGALAIATMLAVFNTSSLVFQGPAAAYLGLSERLLGRVACSTTMLALTGLVVRHDAWGWAIAMVAGALSLTTSVFARQALIFGLPMASLFWWDARPLLVLAVAAGLALLVSRRRFLHGMRHTVVQWKVYATHTKLSREQRETLSRYINVADVWRNRGSLALVGRLLSKREPTRTLARYPELVWIALAVAVAHPHLPWADLVPIVVAVCLYLLTSTDLLNQLGESYRYLEYLLSFALPLVGGVAVTYDSATLRIIVLAGYGLTVLISTYLWTVIVPRHELPGGGHRLSAFLESGVLPSGAVVYPVPMYLAADICARDATWRSFWWQPGIVSRAIYDEFFEVYPFLKREFRTLFETYGVTHVVVDRDALSRIDWCYDFTLFATVGDDGRFVAYEVPEGAFRQAEATAR